MTESEDLEKRTLEMLDVFDRFTTADNNTGYMAFAKSLRDYIADLKRQREAHGRAAFEGARKGVHKFMDDYFYEHEDFEDWNGKQVKV